MRHFHSTIQATAGLVLVSIASISSAQYAQEAPTSSAKTNELKQATVIIKGVDERGRTVYSDTARENVQIQKTLKGRVFEDVKGKREVSMSLKNDAQKPSLADAVKQQQEDLNGSRKAMDEVVSKVKLQNCENAKQSLQILNAPGRAAKIGADGSRQVLDANQIQQERTKINEAIEKNCA